MGLSPAALARVGAVILLFLCGAVACTNSGLGVVDTSIDTDSLKAPPVRKCPWEGTWVLSQASCSSFLITDWAAAYSETRMVIADDGNRMCNITFSWTGAVCAEEETWTVDPGMAVDCLFTVEEEDPTVCYEVVSTGITTCTPEACTFDVDSDAACAVGDRATTTTVGLDDTTIEGELDINGLLAHAWPTCSLDLVTHWVKEL